MNKQQATKLAQAAILRVTIGEPEPVADATVLVLNGDGTYSVCDNGEEAIAQTPREAVNMIVENLTV